MKKLPTISALEWAISQSITQPRQSDEFTCADFLAAGGGISLSAAKNRLARMVELGQLSKRYIVANGSKQSVFRRADAV